jgi:hypothetical protein
MNRCLLILLLLCLGLFSSPRLQAQTADLSTVTEGFVRNMKLLETLTPEADVRDQMAAVSAQAADLGKFFRSKGTASKRRKLFEEQEALKYQEKLSKTDMRKLEDIRADIRDLDPENFFSRARSLYSETQGELSKQLDLIQTSDPVRKDIIRLTRQHLTMYNQALQEY